MAKKKMTVLDFKKYKKEGRYGVRLHDRVHC